MRAVSERGEASEVCWKGQLRPIETCEILRVRLVPERGLLRLRCLRAPNKTHFSASKEMPGVSKSAPSSKCWHSSSIHKSPNCARWEMARPKAPKVRR